MTHRVAILAFDDCHASGVTGPLDLLHAANCVAARLQPGAPAPFAARIVSLDGAPVRAASGLPLAVDGAMADANAAVVIVPGIAVIDPPALDVALTRLAPLGRWLAGRHAQGVSIAATCTGSFLLAEAGLLEGRAATTTTWFAELFEQRYPAVRLNAGATLVEAERLTTSGGAFSYIDLTLHLVERLAGKELARVLARFVVMDNRREPHTHELIVHHVHHHDPLILKAEKWMRAHLKRDIRIDEMAEHLAVSARTLMRRFKERTGESPSAYLQRLRVETAKALLVGTHPRIEQIPAHVGYRDESTFRRLFKKHAGVSPREYRRRFGDRIETPTT
jgi:transcriptional regulator GlxA family with amidase domain